MTTFQLDARKRPENQVKDALAEIQRVLDDDAFFFAALGNQFAHEMPDERGLPYIRQELVYLRDLFRRKKNPPLPDDLLHAQEMVNRAGYYTEKMLQIFPDIRERFLRASLPVNGEKKKGGE